LHVQFIFIVAEPRLYARRVCHQFLRLLQTQRRRGERVYSLITYSYHGTAVSAFCRTCQPRFNLVFCFPVSSPAWGRKLFASIYNVTTCFGRVCSQTFNFSENLFYRWSLKAKCVPELRSETGKFSNRLLLWELRAKKFSDGCGDIRNACDHNGRCRMIIIAATFYGGVRYKRSDHSGQV